MKTYTLEKFFKKFPSISIQSIAERTGINPSLMRQYAVGIKNPSLERLEIIEKAIHDIGKEMADVKIISS